MCKGERNFGININLTLKNDFSLDKALSFVYKMYKYERKTETNRERAQRRTRTSASKERTETQGTCGFVIGHLGGKLG